MIAALISVFVLTYLAIALEEPLKVNKSAAALLGAGLLWTIYALATGDLDPLIRALDFRSPGTCRPCRCCRCRPRT